MNIAIIPARYGSKRIPKKNIRSFFGKPIIAYSIEKAISSKLFDKVIVSTDDETIKNISEKFGAEVPFLRPSKLSDDYTGTTEVVAHAIKWMKNESWDLSTVCCIYATAPFLRLEDLVESYNIFIGGDWDYVFSATEYIYPIEKSIKILNNGSLEMFFPENLNKRSQDLTTCYHDAGQFYWGLLEAWLRNKPIFSKRSTIIKLPYHRVIDIDNEEDWKRAELMYKLLKE